MEMFYMEHNLACSHQWLHLLYQASAAITCLEMLSRAYSTVSFSLYKKGNFLESMQTNFIEVSLVEFLEKYMGKPLEIQKMF